ncbi:hypothetical protein LI99_07700 [Mycolicibacterium smegmatis]|uniref:Uncharacterized protein n=1 Tax=Mycolicibacterium smegmatis (strain ATCC 700084 / mc(2)155) TaxID=246196 RepID=A0QSN5_MYCS2|nr:hypothetical protein MSMEG_1541 [Mycolicibacterium smegmatis MC2 155]AIU13401.1 hypothetical protein LI99_07700 [Mycolicibacterium smegmatis]AIU06776.1 hypothetical protein LJ00_07700 [Mycolicibacterium smegmatis MC2 155]AIU20025.1 hypothetical protein LI98_07700 [Mycolicibacterium smegmatis]TBH44634.1 hypothetical protein EYS45_15705 [Mycolicibacterium smegmatis MC2 155]
MTSRGAGVDDQEGGRGRTGKPPDSNIPVTGGFPGIGGATCG